jgi:hypothetical protein
VELSLPSDPDGAVGGDRQRQVGCIGRIEAGSSGRADLGFDLVDLVRRGGVCVVRPAAEVAVDPQLVDEAGDARQSGLVRLRVSPRGVLAETRGELSVHELVQGAQLGGGVAGDARADPVLVDHDDVEALAPQEQCGEHSGDPRADHEDLGADVAVETRVRRRRAGRNPE